MQVTDNNIESTIKAVEQKIKDLKSTQSRFVPSTNMVMDFFGQKFNINVMKSPDIDLLEVFLKALHNFSEKELEISGFKLSLWIQDIENKKNSLLVKEQLNKLEAHLKTLNEMFSNEKKNEIKFNDILNSIQ